MPIDDFEGRTYVAFLDISGFKCLVGDRQRAEEALQSLYEGGFHVLGDQNENISCSVDGIFVSDCGVLFVRDRQQTTRRDTEVDTRPVESLGVMLRIVKKINTRVLHDGFMLKTSIAFGEFDYRRRIEFPGIGKNSFFGNAYLQAYLDAEFGQPKLQPGRCRIVKENLPLEVSRAVQHGPVCNELSLIRRKAWHKEHLYYYWNVQDPSRIADFERDYSSTGATGYDRKLEVLRSCVSDPDGRPVGARSTRPDE